MDESARAAGTGILLVEDSLDQANLMTRWLAAAGETDVTLAQDGDRGAALAQERRWSLVITDLNLPGSDGLEVIRASKAMHPSTPVLVVTAYKDQSYAAAALREGADGFLNKPFQMDDLVGRVKELLLSGGARPGSQGPTVLAIGAHADDVENGCAGALLRHLDAGERLVILVLTQGEDDGSPSARVGEAELSSRLLGAKVVFADLPAGSVTDGKETVDVVQRVVDAFEPEAVYTHSQHDASGDHRNAYRATIMGAPQVPNVYCYASSSSTVEFRPTLFVEISEHFERKRELLSLFQTPEANRPYLRPAFIEAQALYWGRFAGFGRAEPLEVVRGGPGR